MSDESKVVSLDAERVQRQSTYLGTVSFGVYLSPQGRPFPGDIKLEDYEPAKGPLFRRAIRLAVLGFLSALRDANEEERLPLARELGINLRPFKENR